MIRHSLEILKQYIYYHCLQCRLTHSCMHKRPCTYTCMHWAYSGNILFTYRDVTEVRQISCPSHDLVQTVIGDVKQRGKEVCVALRQFAFTALLLFLVVMHERLDGHQVLEKLRSLWLKMCDSVKSRRLLDINDGATVVDRQYRDDMRAWWRHLSRTGGVQRLAHDGGLTVAGDHLHRQFRFSSLLFDISAVRSATIIWTPTSSRSVSPDCYEAVDNNYVFTQ